VRGGLGEWACFVEEDGEGLAMERWQKEETWKRGGEDARLIDRKEGRGRGAENMSSHGEFCESTQLLCES
jgi:hypothetical protein